MDNYSYIRLIMYEMSNTEIVFCPIRHDCLINSIIFFLYINFYIANVSMIMPKPWYHEHETGSLYFGPLLRISLSFILRTILISPVHIWPHGAYKKCESEQLQGGEDLESRVAANLLCN